MFLLNDLYIHTYICVCKCVCCVLCVVCVCEQYHNFMFLLNDLYIHAYICVCKCVCVVCVNISQNKALPISWTFEDHYTTMAKSKTAETPVR